MSISINNVLDLDSSQIIDFMNTSCLETTEMAKQNNGEVFTPMSKVIELLDKLDTFYVKKHRSSIFSNPQLKWFDPAVGIGNFMVGTYLKLMTGLACHFPDDKLRKRHIIENMLYMSELNAKNVTICHEIFDSPSHKANIYCGDTLLLDIFSQWRLERPFDVVIGNPPYNKGGIRSNTGKKMGNKTQTIWAKFVQMAFSSWLITDGYLVFITPLSWLKKTHTIHDDIVDKHILWLNLWDNNKSNTEINVQIPISIFILHNIPNLERKHTEIVSEMKHKKIVTTSVIYLDKIRSIPLAYHSIFEKLSAFITTNELKLEYKSTTIESNDISFPLPSSYSLDNQYAVDTVTIKRGIVVKTAIEQHPDANKFKLIIANKSGFTRTFIDDGRLSLTGNHKFYILGDDLEKLLKLFNTKLCNMLCQFTKYSQDFLDKEVFQFIPDIRKSNDIMLCIDDEHRFYECIGFTPDEIIEIMKYT
jgi:hypothetical protein